MNYELVEKIKSEAHEEIKLSLLARGDNDDPLAEWHEGRALGLYLALMFSGAISTNEYISFSSYVSALSAEEGVI